MKKIIVILFVFVNLTVIGQKNPNEQAETIVQEGKRLYKSEMASWYGTDIFLENYKDKANIGGYFSYANGDSVRCVFFSNTDEPKIIGTISFDSTYDIKTANKDFSERDFTTNENAIYIIRKISLDNIKSDTSLFRTYKNSSLNLIPLLNDSERKVFVLTGPSKTGVVIFGNDYLLTFDNDNHLVSKKQLHRNIIPINYDGKENEGAIHMHLPETGAFITATDICTLMLYEKFAKWQQHTVVSEKYINIWNCLTDKLLVIPKSTVDKINKDQEKQKKKQKDK